MKKDRMAIVLSSRHFLSILMAKDMKDSVSKAAKIAVAIGIAFEDLYFVVAAFGKAVCIGMIKGIHYAVRPIDESVRAGNESWDIRILGAHYPFGHQFFCRLFVVGI